MQKSSIFSACSVVRQGLLAILFALLSLLAPALAGAQTTSGSFNHDTTMFPLRGAHEIVRCETCHINGVFKGTPRQCNLCHVQGNRTSALPEPMNHIPVSEQCDVCHNTSSFGGTQFTHVSVTQGTCNTCHNGYYAQGKSPTPPHPYTTASCDVCHTVGAFLPVAMFDHAAAGIFPAPAHTGPACDSCHNGSKAVGKPPGHVPVPASAACDDCHRQTTAWRPALFDHEAAGIHSVPQTGAACSSCHNGSYSIGKPSGFGHIPTTQDCALCHDASPIKNPGGFSLGQMNHLGITSGCVTCHAANTPYAPLNGKAVENPNTISNHIPIGTAGCESCHAVGAFDKWSGAVMNHSVVTSLSCASCHEDGKNYAGLSSSTPLVMRSSLGTHVPVSTSIACSTCHGSTVAFESSVNFSTTGVHQSGVTSQGCTTCHANAAGPYAAKIPLINMLSTAVVSTSGLPHIAVAGSTDCQSCHVPGNISSYTPGNNGFRLAGSPSSPALTSAQHAYASGSCQSCHDSAPALYAGIVESTDSTAGDTYPSATLDAGHQSFSKDCTSCHSTAPVFHTNATGGAKPAGHVPTSTLACSACHGSSGYPMNQTVIDTLHPAVAGVGMACTACHNSATSSGASSIGLGTPNIVFNSATTHIPIGTLGNTAAAAGSKTCNASGCHAAYSGIGGFHIANASTTSPSLSVAGHSSVLLAGQNDCRVCHESTAPAYQGMVASTSTTVGDTRPNSTLDSVHPSSGDCSACHSTSPSFTNNYTANAAAQPTGHVPAGGASCGSCHTATGGSAALLLPSIVSTHTANTGEACEICHNATVAGAITANAAALGTGGADNRPTVYQPGNHIPFGSVTCGGTGGCHANYSSSQLNFKLSASGTNTGIPSVTGITTLSVANHTLVSGQSCQSCHGSGLSFIGMDSTSTPNDFFPTAAQDPVHQAYAGDCGGCHKTTAPTFATNLTALPPKHLPTGSAGINCVTCHTVTGVYDTMTAAGLQATHAATGMPSGCLSCHSASVVATALTSASLKPKLTTSSPGTHIPILTMDCVSCHANYSSTVTSFFIAAANINPSTLSVAQHAAASSAGLGTCGTCHTTSGGIVYYGMLASQVGGGDQFPSATEDAAHQNYVGDCKGCHTTTPTFRLNATVVPTGHIPVNSVVCSTCHGLTGVYTAPNLLTTHTATGQACVACHVAAVASGVIGSTVISAANRKLVYDGSSGITHIPFTITGGALGCDSAGCHASFAKSGGSATGGGSFVIASGSSGSISNPSLSPTGHLTLLNQAGAASCGTCHTNSTGGIRYTGMVLSANGNPGNDQFPDNDSAHPGATANTSRGSATFATEINCGNCHTTTPTFASSGATGGTLPTNHIPLSAFSTAPACGACHINPTSYKVATMNHAGLTGGCLTCHGVTAISFVNVTPKFQPPTHIPTNLTGIANACETCHRNAVTGNFASFAGTVMDHGGLTTSCISCHAVGKTSSFYGVTIVVPPNAATDGHQYVATLACEKCHTNTLIPGGFLNGKFVHSALGTVTPCVRCHETGSKFTGASNLWVRKSGHNGTQDCSSSGGCHSTSDKSLGTGTTAAAGAVVSPASLVMSSAAIGTAATRVLTLTNSGTAALTVTSLVMSGTNLSDFTQTNTCGTSLAAATTCSITVSFKPTAAGNRTATLTITDSAASKTQTVALSGAVATTNLLVPATGLSIVQGVAISTTWPKPATPPTQPLTFKNVSTAALTVSSVTLTGTNAADFSATNGCTGSIAAGASCTISVAFNPVASPTTQEVATLNIVNSGFPSTYSISVVGSLDSVASAAAKRARALSGVLTGPLAGSQIARIGGGRAAMAVGTVPVAPVSPSGLTPPAGPPNTLAAVLALPKPGSLPGASVPPPAGTRPQLPGTGTPTTGLPGATVPGGLPGTQAGSQPPGSSLRPPLPAALLAGNGFPNPGMRGAGGLAAGSNGAPGGPSALAGLSGSQAAVVPGAPYNHVGAVPGQCATACHNGRTASGLPPKHMKTVRSCDACHRVSAWTPVSYQHVSPRYKPHDASVACLGCHTSNMETVVVRNPQFGTDCAACHADRFRPQQHRRADRPTQFYLVSELRDCAGACHVALPGRMGTSPTMFGYHRSTAPAW